MKHTLFIFLRRRFLKNTVGLCVAQGLIAAKPLLRAVEQDVLML